MQLVEVALLLIGLTRVHSHAPSIRSHRGTKVVWPDFQPIKIPEEPVSIHLFRKNPVFTSFHLKSPVHVVPPQVWPIAVSLLSKTGFGRLGRGQSSSRLSAPSIATLPPFGPIKGHNGFSKFFPHFLHRNRFAFISFNKLQFLPPYTVWWTWDISGFSRISSESLRRTGFHLSLT